MSRGFLSVGLCPGVNVLIPKRYTPKDLWKGMPHGMHVTVLKRKMKETPECTFFMPALGGHLKLFQKIGVETRDLFSEAFRRRFARNQIFYDITSKL